MSEYAFPTYIPPISSPPAWKRGQMPLISTFRLLVRLHTRYANSKWLDEIAHTNPLRIHPTDAAHLGVETGDLARAETGIGHYGGQSMGQPKGGWWPASTTWVAGARKTEKASRRHTVAVVDLANDGNRGVCAATRGRRILTNRPTTGRPYCRELTDGVT
jgi:anaerobic selenocysteine-containing dehydrogenase